MSQLFLDDFASERKHFLEMHFVIISVSIIPEHCPFGSVIEHRNILGLLHECFIRRHLQSFLVH